MTSRSSPGWKTPPGRHRTNPKPSGDQIVGSHSKRVERVVFVSADAEDDNGARGWPRARRCAEDGVIERCRAGDGEAVSCSTRDDTAKQNTKRMRSPFAGMLICASDTNGGEFDPGSGLTLAACLMHASRTRRPSGCWRGGRVRSAWATCPGVGGSHGKPWVIPHEVGPLVGGPSKGSSDPPPEGPASD